jgi:hypothetical protein
LHESIYFYQENPENLRIITRSEQAISLMQFCPIPPFEMGNETAVTA